MSDTPPTLPFGLPSRNYSEARASSVYRLSELMFGSLLASYILGFIGQASSLSTGEPFGLEAVIRALLNHPSGGVDCLLVSITFSYFTASLFVTYHAGLLTMRASLKRLRWDFVIALSQAVLFGVSLLNIRLFPLAFGVAVLLVLARQRFEVVILSKQIYRKLSKDASTRVEDDEADDDRDFDEPDRDRQKKIQNYLGNQRHFRSKTMKPLQGWTSPSIWSWLSALLLVLCGIGLVTPSLENGLRQNHADAALHVTILAVMIYQGHRTLGAKGKLLTDSATGEMKAMDKAAHELYQEITVILSKSE